MRIADNFEDADTSDEEVSVNCLVDLFMFSISASFHPWFFLFFFFLVEPPFFKSYSYKNFTTYLTFYKTSLITLQQYRDDTMGSERQ